MEALRAVPPDAQLEAVASLTDGANAYDGAVAGYDDWTARNPNTAAVAGAVSNIIGNRNNKGALNVH